MLTRSDTVVQLLERYPAFKHFRVLPAYLRDKPVVANNLLVSAFAVLLFLGSWLDATLIIPGVGIGLLEHPTLLSFLLLQAVVFRAAVDSLEFLRESHSAQNFPFAGSFTKEGAGGDFRSEGDQYFSRTTNLSRFFFASFATTGLACLVWNSLQNQNALHYLGFDFWDSSGHFFGYWTSRVYKLYLWVFFIPSLIHILAGISILLARVVTRARSVKALEIAPFHSDGIGGMSILVIPVIKPLRSAFFVCSLAAVSALAVHREPDLTPLLGITLLALCLLSIFILYLLPLGKAIEDAKAARLADIGLQQERLLETTASPRATTAIANSIAAIQGLEEVKRIISELPSYPQLRAVTKFFGLLLGSQYLLASARILIAIVTERLLQ